MLLYRLTLRKQALPTEDTQVKVVRKKKNAVLWLLGVLAISGVGCSTTRLSDTPRTGVEQLLISNAIDASLDKFEFEGLGGAKVFVDEKYVDCVDRKYLIGSIRRRAFQSGARLVDKTEEADLVVEVHSGAVGTDRSEGFLGTQALSVPGPFSVQLPEVKLLSQSSQYGTAKISLVAYDAKTREAVSMGGLARARSSDKNWTVLGVGPIRTGDVRDEIGLAGRRTESDWPIVLSQRNFWPQVHASLPPNQGPASQGAGPHTPPPSHPSFESSSGPPAQPVAFPPPRPALRQ